MNGGTQYRDFQVALSDHLLGTWVNRHTGLWMWLSDLETRALPEEIRVTPVDRPIYISGLARSGSTILLEMLAAIRDVGTHKYRDFPPIWTPVWWNRFLDHMPRRGEGPVERAHRDGITITPESPEAIEEVLWMAFFPESHDPLRSNILDAATTHLAFERFYREHIRKLLFVRNARRYVSKANYNVARLEYILKLFPDARFVVPIREPASHVASMMKQHALFGRGLEHNPRGLAYLRRLGHFEFGPDRRPINVGEHERTLSVIELWSRGEEVRGWARYWTLVHSYVVARLDADAALRAAVILVRFEELCAAGAKTMTGVFDHCGLEAEPKVIATQAGRLRYPSYYRPSFSAQDRAVIVEETHETAARLGYSGTG